MIVDAIQTFRHTFLKRVPHECPSLATCRKATNTLWEKNIVFFDGKVKRCRNFVSLTASTYHPLLKRQIVLAVMESEHEDSKNIELFWNLFNDALKHSITENQANSPNVPNVVFNPIGWCTDIAVCDGFENKSPTSL